MSDVLEHSALERWQREPISFINEVLRNPKTNKPFELFDAQKQFFKYAWQRRDDGRLLYPEQCLGMIKKTGKTGSAAMHVLTTTLVFGGRYAEAYCLANDLEQAQGRVFTAIKQICESSPLLRREAEITQWRITFPQTGAVIQAIGADATSAAGAHPVISSIDELWGVQSERTRRLYDEMVPVPTQQISCRLVTTHAGYEGESTLLEEMCKRGEALPEIAPGLHAGNHMLYFWSHEPLAPWQTEAWLEEMRQITRPIQFIRQFENRFVSSEGVFIDMSAWDACVDERLGAVPADRFLKVYIGVDASLYHDQTALVCVTFDTKTKRVRLVCHAVFQPTREDPINFEETVERTLRGWCKKYQVRKILYDPFQMQAVAQRLIKDRLPMQEFPQTSGNLTLASQCLFDLINGHGLIAYPNPQMRKAISQAVAKETSRGWRITKSTSAHKIDLVAALSFACYGCIQGQSEPQFSALDMALANHGEDYFKRGS
jgi:phage terminase large subunit-like protein